MKAERIGVEAVALILGENVRTVQAMAAAGKIPSAAKPAKKWTFNETIVRDWLAERENERCPSAKTRRTPTGGGIRYGGGSPSPAARSGGAYELAMQKLRQAGSKQGANRK